MPPHFLRGSSTLVIRCFKKVESWADWITGAAGPFFVGLCWILIIGGGLAFFDVIARDLSFVTSIILSPIFIIIPINLYGHYYLVTHIPPGHPAPKPSGPTNREIKWLIPNPKSFWSVERYGWKKRGRPLSSWSSGAIAGEVSSTKRVRRCRKCDGPKPERTHHCSVCKRCVLQMDHHCPWINGCVGLHNQRYFVLFMFWLSAACWTVCALGLPRFWDSFNMRSEWPAYTPRIGYTLLYVLAIAIGLAVPILMSWHLWMVAHGETSIESHDNQYLEGRAKSEGLIYLNPYDLGKRRNLELFFNIGATGFPNSTLLFPLTVPPYSNGWTWPRRTLPITSSKPPGDMHLHAPELADGLSKRSSSAENGLADGGESKYVMDDGGYDLTDDEEGGGGWMEISAEDIKD